jgi:tRNA-dihydrouridine synthase 1
MNGLSLVQNVEGSPRSTTQKLHGRAFYESIGSPKMIVAPMVDRSEFVGTCAYI